ncbi:MAG: class I tRNA ligase family protein, partial [Candidatus Gastranaerophilales bacterium]|nr:class I tRNA ligase family protein [Candidatus Gastranaerophilales bacterium]
CISRQLWWGHQIPAYYCDDCGEMIVATKQPEKCPKCSSSKITQETDVLDTWFSSALWPFSTMGWPNTESPDFKKYYPTSTLVTGFDIIFFWVSRMVVMGYAFTEKSPFKDVYIHGLIRDEHGQKMSKSKGNTIDPVVIIDKYGCDALRYTLVSLVTYGGQDIKVSDERFEFGRNFANKIWNASRFVLMNLEGADDKLIDFNALTVADKWILHKLNESVKEVNKNLASYRFGEAAQELYEFFWNTYCDWYVELAKAQLQDSEKKLNTQRILRYVLERTLRLLHPMMPHITEEIWQLIPGETYKDGNKAVMMSKFPEEDASFENKDAENSMNLIIESIRSIRNVRQSLNIPVSSRINIHVYSENEPEKNIFEQAKPYISSLTRVDGFEISLGIPKEVPPQSATAVVSTSRVVIPLAGLIDIDKEIQRQKKKVETLQKEKQGLDGRINNAKFVQNAPKEVIEQTNERIIEINQQTQAIEELLKSLIG